jgi:hypothetical protein
MADIAKKRAPRVEGPNLPWFSLFKESFLADMLVTEGMSRNLVGKRVAGYKSSHLPAPAVVEAAAMLLVVSRSKWIAKRG